MSMNKTERFTRLHRLFTEKWEEVHPCYPPRPTSLNAFERLLGYEEGTGWKTIRYDSTKDLDMYRVSRDVMSRDDWVFYWQSLEIRRTLLKEKEDAEFNLHLQKELEKELEEDAKFRSYLMSY